MDQGVVLPTCTIQCTRYNSISHTSLERVSGNSLSPNLVSGCEFLFDVPLVVYPYLHNAHEPSQGLVFQCHCVYAPLEVLVF